MRLEKVKPALTTVRLLCVNCQYVGSVPPREGSKDRVFYADLDGIAFIDYYCEHCAGPFLLGRVKVCLDALREGGS